MAIDLTEFHDVFFEECFELLEVMESELLNLDHGTDIEQINAIFRAAHSIKGGGSTFGFMEMSSFTHVMETFLDEMRDGRRAVSRAGVDLLLESVDVLRGMVNAQRDKQEHDHKRITETKQKLEAMLADTGSASKAKPKESSALRNTPPKDESATNAESKDGPAETNGWRIKFRPEPGLLKGGNEPSRIFRELQSLGDLRVEADTTDVPALEVLDPELCHLKWMLTLHGNIDHSEIEELFSWVIDESDLEIKPLGNAGDDALAAEEPPAEIIATSNTVAESAALAVAKSTDASHVSEPPEQSKGSNPAARESGSSSIRVATDKVDELINIVGELVITQSMLSQISNQLVEGNTKTLERLLGGISQLERNTRELQESILSIRMLPISFSFNRFPRLVRDLSGKMGKQVELKMTGENTEVDKTVLEKIGDPLVHLVRNALDHGIEMPEVRKAAGKPETGNLELCAYHEGGDIIIKVIDDGAGLNRDRILKKALEKGLINENEDSSEERIYNLIFAPGFSTAEKISDVSGRGVGMDVVRRNVRNLGGNVSIASNAGAGSTVTIRLPLTLAILDGQLARIGNETYIVSLVSIVESLQMKSDQINSIAGRSEFYRLRNDYVPIIRVNQLFGIANGKTDLREGLLMVVEADGRRVGLFVDDLMGQQQVVIKSLEANFRQVESISGATILGDGTVALIIDVPGLIHRHFADPHHGTAPLSAVA